VGVAVGSGVTVGAGVGVGLGADVGIGVGVSPAVVTVGAVVAVVPVVADDIPPVVCECSVDVGNDWVPELLSVACVAVSLLVPVGVVAVVSEAEWDVCDIP